MKNEELKKKIIEVLEETEYEWTEQKNGYILQIFYDKLADALIAAGIGDEKEAEHRAEVAEMALKILIKNQYSRCAVPTELCNGVGCGSDECKKIILEYYLQQAEKELEEEREDD